MSHLTHAPVQRACETLHVLSANEDARYWADAREKALRDEATRFGEARDEGRQQARRNMALTMLQDGQIDVAAIARYSGLSEEQMHKLGAAMAG